MTDPASAALSIELACLFWSTVLLFAIIAVQGATVPVVQGFGWGLGSRDEPRDRTVFQRRLDRIVANHIEGLTVFAALVVVAHLAGISTGLTETAAVLFLIGRIGFAALYAAGVPYLRSIAWGVSATGTLLLAFAIGGAALGAGA